MNINYYNPYVREELMLYHHGVLGQRWGKKNGPPYPIAPGAHSAAEKRAGWQDSLSKGGTRSVARELNRLDKNRATAAFDYANNQRKALKYERKQAKANSKGKTEKAEKFGAKAKKYNNIAERYQKNRKYYEDKLSKAIKEVNNKGFDVHAKQTDRLVHAGRAIAVSTLKTAGIMSIAMFSGSPITAAVITRYQSPGNTYKVKQAPYGMKGQVYQKYKKKNTAAVILRPTINTDNREYSINKLRV